MSGLAVIVSRFLKLLPFLTTPNAYRRFHYEFWLPFPDSWDEVDGSSSTAGRPVIRARRKIVEEGPYPEPHPYLPAVGEIGEFPRHQDPFW